MQKSVLNSPRILELKKKKRYALRKKLIISLVLFIGIFVGLVFLSRWPKINIKNVEISGNEVMETNLIADVVNEKLSGYYFWLFPRTLSFFYPKNQIADELTFRFRRIRDISLNLKDLNTLDIVISERKAAYTYCGADLPTLPLDTSTLDSEKCYFLDDNGYIFDEAPYFSGEVYTKFYGDTKLDNPSGTYFFPSIFDKLITLKEELEKINLKPAIFYIKDNGDISVFLSSPSLTTRGPEIIFNTDSDFEQVMENLQSVLDTEPLKSDFVNKYSSLQYIDLRFGNKVYYKFSST
jgi:hypothetical protein